jgi:hypothetical protein
MISKRVLKTRLKTKDHANFAFRKIPCGFYPNPLDKCILSVFGRLIEYYYQVPECWEKSKNKFGLCAPNLSKNRRQICWVVL